MPRVDDLSIRARVALSTSTQAIGSVLMAGISIIVLHLSTNHLGPSRYGYLTTIVAIVSVLSLLADLGLTTTTTRELAIRPKDAPTILGDNLASRAVLSVAMVPLISIVAYIAYPTERSTVVLGVFIMSFDILLNAFTTTCLTYFASRTRSDIVGLVTLYGKVVYLLAVVLATAVDGDIFTYVRAYLAGDVSAAALALCLVLRRTNIRFRLSPRRSIRIMRKALPLGILQVMGSIYLWMGSISLSLFERSADVAFYGVCVGYVLSVASMSGYFMGSLLPTLATTERSDVSPILQRAWDLMVFVALAVAVETISLRRSLIDVVVGRHFEGATTPLAILACVVVLMYLSIVLNVVAIALDNVRALLLVQGAGLAIELLLNLILVPRFAVDGAAYAIFAAEAGALSISYSLFRKRFRLRIALRSTIRMLLSAVAASGVAYAIVLAMRRDPTYAQLIAGGPLIALVYLDIASLANAIPAELMLLRRLFLVKIKSRFA